MTVPEAAQPTFGVVENTSAHPDPAAPVVSLCIPTFNRARYLRCLLPLLAEELAAFPHRCEVVVSDNASTDDTPAVLGEFVDRLPLRVIRHETNQGAYANVRHVLGQGRGEFLVYLADDDMLAFEELAALITRLKANPGIVAAYAPWIIHDLVDNRTIGTFYQQTEDVLIRQGDQRALLDTVLRLKAFPEIVVARRDAWHALDLRINPHAFWAFVFASAYVGRGEVLFSSRPFYVSISRYFAGPPRTQVGMEEVETSWDCYRGGLEFILGRALGQLAPADHAALLTRINPMIAQRMAVAIRLRHARERNAVDTYHLACRLRGLGHEKKLPVPLATLALRAALWSIVHEEPAAAGAPALVCNDPLPDDARCHLASVAGERVRFDVPAEAVRDCVLLVASDETIDAAARERHATANVRCIGLRQALARLQT